MSLSSSRGKDLTRTSNPINNMSPGNPIKKAVQFPVHNLQYPRNRRVREYLRGRGWECTPIVRGKNRQSTTWEKVVALTFFLKAARSSDVIMLSEMSLKYAPLTWALSRIYRSAHVVDGFIGLYETDVEDKRVVRPNSMKARILKFQDRVAVALSDIYLVDTEVRATRIRDEFGAKRTVLSLPVGAPSWAQPTEWNAENGMPQVLYYGNYIPLHGLREYVLAVSKISAAERPLTKMIGAGDCYNEVYNLVCAHGLADFFLFSGPVPENQLAEEISNAKVVLGVFGSSTKAASVIANKVWQGLACSRLVITRQSSALDEISAIAGDLLVQVPAEDPAKLSAAILAAITSEPSVAPTNISRELEAYVEDRFDRFLLLLNSITQSQAKDEAALGDRVA